MLSLKAQLEKLKPGDRPHVIRVTRAVLNQTLIDLLAGRDNETNPIRASVGASLLAKAIDTLNEFPEADDVMPTAPEIRYSAD